jgi:type II secretory pathway component PulF
MMATQAVYALALAIPVFPDILGHANLDTGIMPGVRLYLIHEAILLPLTFALIQLIKYGWSQLQQPQWRRLRDQWTLRIPPYGDLHRQAALSAFIRMLRRLYHAGVSPSAAWEGAMQTASNVVIRERLAASGDMMQRGIGLSEAFSATGLFNNQMEQLLTTGQLSGQVVESLDQVAEFYQEQVETSADKSRKAMFFAGRLVLLVLGGITMAWLLHSCYAATFHAVDENFKVPD